MKNRLSLIAESAEIERMLVESEGEITPEIEALLRPTSLSEPSRIDIEGRKIDRLVSTAEEYRAIGKSYLRVAKAAERAAKQIHSSITEYMAENGLKEICGEEVVFKERNSPPAVYIPDESQLDQAYVLIETITHVDRKRIAEDLRMGYPVKGAELKQSTHVQKQIAKPKLIGGTNE